MTNVENNVVLRFFCFVANAGTLGRIGRLEEHLSKIQDRDAKHWITKETTSSL